MSDIESRTWTVSKPFWIDNTSHENIAVVPRDDYDRLAAELAEKVRWQEDAVRLCATRGCAQRDKRIADLEAELSAARADARTHALEFAGYLSGALPELHAVEVGRIYSAYEEFAARAALSASSAPAPKCPKCGMLQSECDAQMEYDERIPPVI